MRIIFMGTPAFAVPALQALMASEHDVIAAYSQPPRPAGRGKKLTPSAIHQLADAHNIPVFTPKSLKNAEAQQELADLNADIAVVAAYGLLLPRPILNAPTHGCINIHPSDLPRWRGAAPIQRSIMAGDTHTACCIMQMDEGLDTGDVLLRKTCNIAPGTTAGMLHDSMAQLGASMVLETLTLIAQGQRAPAPQSNEGVCYAEKISKEELSIDWRWPPDKILNHINGLSPLPAAYCHIQGERVKILSAKIVDSQKQAPPGQIYVQNGVFIQTIDRKEIQLIAVKREGKPAQNIADIYRNWPVMDSKTPLTAS